VISQALIEIAQSSPLLTVGVAGGVVMTGYLATQWWALISRQRFETKRNRLELAALSKRIEILNRQAQASPETAWNGYRKFTVAKKVQECPDTYSFYLTPHNSRPLPPFKPGQYLTFQLHPPGADKPLVRCYSLSDGFLTDAHYRVTIKRALPPGDVPDARPGIISSYFCDNVAEGDILDVKAPMGHFCLEVEENRPAVLISGGIGITPMLAMARALTHLGDKRETFFFFGCRNGEDHMFRDEMVALQQANPNLRLHVCYSRPRDGDVPGKSFNHEGRVTIELLKQILPSSNYEFYLCGPGPFMDTLVHGLYDWGVPKKDVKFEAFGPATVKTGPKEIPEPKGNEPTVEVEFARTGKKLTWDPALENLLAFAEHNGISTIEGGCRAGSCGSCLVAIKSGDIEYEIAPGDPPEEGSCLTCICRPKGNLVIDA
jgi:uncharacterized protein